MTRILGIDLGGTNTKVVVVDEAFTVLDRLEFPTEAAEGPDAFAARLRSNLESEGLRGDEFAAVGYSVAGLITRDGRISQAPNLVSFEGLDARSLLEGWTDCRALAVENDVNCALVGEHRCGAGRGARNLCMLSLGTGVGGGILVEGRLYHGATGLAAELGHMVLQHDGPTCACGLPGHVESYLSTDAIVRRAEGVLRNDAGEASILAEMVAEHGRPTPRILSLSAQKGCEVARELLAECGRWLGIACSNLAHALQPERILIGGGVSRAGDLLLVPAAAEFEARCMRAVKGTVELRRAELGVDGAAIGAAVLAFDLLDGAAPAAP